MAAVENMTDIGIQKNSKIVVNVDESLPDILVVTYEHGSKIFKGVLLDSTKRNLPCGVSSLHPAFSNDKADGDDKLYSVTQRYGYQEGTPSKEGNIPQKRQVRLPARYKNAKMTVRLRPRQVLCSKCRGICNENSENVDNSRKRKSTEEETRQQPKRTLGVSTRTSKPLISDSQNNEQTRTCLPLRLPIPPQEANGHSTEEDEEEEEETEKYTQQSTSSSKSKKNMVLRKKHSVGSMEDLWDESVFEENQLGELGTNTRTIKISFGREGEGTILKIPAKIDDLVTDSEKDRSSKAARRALKKAKKEARRKILLGSGGSPCYTLGGNSPRYTALAGNGSPRFGGTSPRYTLTSSTAGYENLVPRRHKHKVKHKKKHREERRQREEPSSNAAKPASPAPGLGATGTGAVGPEGASAGTTSSSTPDTYLKEIKERCLKQKLSINLKRVNAEAYASRGPAETEADPDADVEESRSPEGHSSDDGHGESAPDFPPPSQPLMMHLTAKAVASAMGADGRRLAIGDVVWGKIHGFPWWPGKVLSITSDGGSPDAPQQAHVAWYGSSTSSLMPCHQLSPFLENFKIRYNKKKRGPYKEAIKQATCEARTESLPSPVSIPPALASPREIDVVS